MRLDRAKKAETFDAFQAALSETAWKACAFPGQAICHFRACLVLAWKFESQSVLAVVSLLYAVFGVVLVGAYIPQLLSVWRSRTGAADVSLLTWSVWSASATVTLLYAGLVARHFEFVLVSVGNLVGCYAVTGCVVYRRWSMKKREAVWLNTVPTS